jgi:hypothetical protein
MKKRRVILMGGLGNQLFQYAFALSLSKQLNEEVYLDPNIAAIRLDNSGRPELSKFILNENVIIKEYIKTPKTIRKLVGLGIRLSLKIKRYPGRFFLDILKFLLNIHILYSFRENSRVFFASDNGYDKSFSERLYSHYFGYFQTYKFGAEPGEREELIKLEPKITSNNVKAFADKSRIDKPLIVHIRLTDYRSEPNFGIPSKDYYRKAIEHQIKLGIYGKIWLFSDEATEAPKYVPTEYLSIVENISAEISDTVETIEIMRFGKGYVLANSSFSWWAASLSHELNAPTIYPSPWFSGMPTPDSLCPPAWLPFAR